MTDFPANANCSEPYRIGVTEVPTGNGLTDSGGKTTLKINVYDHQGKASYKTPKVECSNLFTGTKDFSFVETVNNYDTWTVDLDNSNSAHAGRYKVLISVEDNDNATSQSWVNLTAYQIYTVMVVPGTALKGWAVTFGGDDADQVMAQTTDTAGNVFVTGFFTDDCNFNPKGQADKISNGNFDAFLAKYDPSGNFLWVNTWGGDSDDVGENVAMDGANVLVYGYYYDTVDFPATAPMFGNRTATTISS